MKSKNTNIPRVIVRVIDPETGASVDAAEWLEKPEEIRKKAEWVEFDAEYGQIFRMHKSNAPGGQMKFTAAQKAAASVCEGGRCGTRLEFLLIQYARENNDAHVDELLTAIGGDNLKDWLWTEEPLASTAALAWFFSGTYGSLYCSSNRIIACCARVFRAL